MTSTLQARRVTRVVAIAVFALVVEWSRSLIATLPGAGAAALLAGGVVLCVTAWGYTPEQLGLGRGRWPLRALGGLALAAVLLLPAAVRTAALPQLPATLALAAVAVSVGEEVAFRGALYAALDELGGPVLAVGGSTLAWTAAHALSHPPAFLWAVAAAGLLLGLWRWACNDLAAPIAGHVIADLAL